MYERDPFELALRAAFAGGDLGIDEEVAWFAILARGRLRQRRRTAAGVAILAAAAAVLVALLILTTTSRRLGTSVMTRPIPHALAVPLQDRSRTTDQTTTTVTDP
jgi:hypothetical protein